MQKTFTGIDIGTEYVKVIIAAPPDGTDAPLHILATATAPSKGVRQGYIADPRDAAHAIRDAVLRASQAAHVTVRSARISVGGISLEEAASTAEITLTASGGIVGHHDIERVLAESEKRAAAKLTNRVVVHTIPLEFRIDGNPIPGRPLGLQGTKLAVDTLLITMLAQHHDDFIEAVEGAGVEVEGVMAAPLAASLALLTKAQKTAGVCLANIGAETLSLVIFDNDRPVSIKVFPTGSADITHAIALAFQLPLPEAEQLKRGAVTGSTIPAAKLNTVITSQLKNLFGLVNGHLKLLKRDRLLPAGIVLTGGGASLGAAVDVARSTLKLPAQTGVPAMSARVSPLDATWASALGLCRWGYAEARVSVQRPLGDLSRAMMDGIRSIFRAFLP